MAPTPVYDDEKERQQHPDEGAYGDHAGSDDLESAYNAPAIKDHERNTPSHRDLARREAEGDDDASSESDSGTSSQNKEKKALDDKTGGGFYRHEGGKADQNSGDSQKRSKAGALLFGARGKLDEKTGNLSSRNKKLLFGAGIGGSGMFVVILVLIVLFATLKIPNLAEHIASWQMARTARTFRQSLNQVNSEKIAVDSVDDNTHGVIRQKYDAVRGSTWGKLDKWRPGLTYKNMQATGLIDYQYSDPNLAGRRKLEVVRVNGTDIQVDNPTFAKRLANRVNPLTPKADIILAANVEANLENALDGHHSLVRGSVAKKIQTDLKIELHWWDKKGKTFRNAKSAAEADLMELRERAKRIDADPGEGSSVKPIDEAKKQADAAQEACIKDDDCAKQFLQSPDPNNPDAPSNLLAESAKSAIDSNVDNTAIKALEFGSQSFEIAMFACTIYDGSVERSGGTVDANSASAQRAFYAIASAGAQQRSGDTTAEATGATNRALGDYSSSIPEKRARNKNLPVSTDTVASPQASAGGMFSLFDAIMGEGIGSKFNPFVEPFCGQATRWEAGALLTVAEAAAAVITGGGSKMATTAGGKAGTKVAIGQVVSAIRKSLVSKQALKRILGETAAAASLTVVAKMIVLSRMNTQYSGVARESGLANNADAGGNLAASEIDRKMLGGRPLTQTEVAYSDQANRQYLAQKKGELGAFERYLALSNPDSLLVNMGVAASTQLTNKNGPSNLLANMATRFNSSLVGGGMFASVSPFKKQVALAQTQNSIDTNYQNVQWGWSEDESALIANDPDYFPLQNDAVLEASGRKGEIETDYGYCFNDTVGTLLKDKKIHRDENGRVYESIGDGKDGCTPKSLGRSNPKYGDLVFRWRLTKRNNAVLDHLTDIQAPTNSASASASPANPGGGLGVSADGFTFPLKTTKAVITSNSPPWCYQKQDNCHHHYNAADVHAPTGTVVVAVKPGKVIFGHNKPTGGTGSSIAIMGDDKNVYWYGHLKSGSVKFSGGETVTAGTILGEVGTDADAQGTPSHLHIDAQGPPATTREGCTNQACSQPPFNFLDIQPALKKSFEALPG